MSAMCQCLVTEHAKKKIIFSLYFDVHQKQIAQLIYKRQKKLNAENCFMAVIKENIALNANTRQKS